MRIQPIDLSARRNAQMGIKMNMFVYQCEDSLEGIFTSIYNVYEDKRSSENVRINLTDEAFLFAEHIPVETNHIKAQKVINTLRRRFGEEDYYRICMALSTPDDKKAQAVYKTVAGGLEKKCSKGHLFDDLVNEQVNLAFSLARKADREYGQWREFLRFEELEKGILYARINAENHIIDFLLDHFADRFPIENFMIYDENRRLLGIHPASASWYLVRCTDEPGETFALSLSDKEEAYQELFRCFYHSIAIRERENPKLQRNMLPLKFREYMTEFR